MKCLIIDDHALFRQGLLLLLSKLPGEHAFLEAGSCAEAFALADTHPDLDLILLDLALPGLHGLEGLTRLRTLWPTTPIVLLSANENPQMVIDGMNRGAQGFIPKSVSSEVMLAALQVVLAGGTYLPALGIVPTTAPPAERSTLTARQREVLRLLQQNKSNKEIAEALGMRVNTVRVHVAAILKALGVENRTEAARAALRLGLLTNDH